MQDKRFHLVSLGCSKNTVDSQSMAQLLDRAGYQPTDHGQAMPMYSSSTPAAFIGPAKDESYTVLG